MNEMEMVYNWIKIPDKAFVNYLERLELVEQLLDESISKSEKRQIKAAYREKHKISDRTVRLYVHRYKTKGPLSLLHYKNRVKPERIPDKVLREKILDMIAELPTRSVPQLRRLLDADEDMRDRIAKISNRTVYRFLEENGLGFKERHHILSETGRQRYHAFEASHSLQLVQGDARDGIWLPGENDKPVKCFLFLWIDDYSRKILFGKYYANEKLPFMEDSLKYMILRYGIPEKIYIDNGSVYISRHFAYVCCKLGIKKIHHKPYMAHCKGKIEADNKIIKHQFQDEAQLAQMKSLQELNTAFWAWCDVYYNKTIHSSTGETPDNRFMSGLKQDRKRVVNIEEFNSYFLWPTTRTVSKYGLIKLFSNEYPVTKAPYGRVIQVRYNPFDLSEIFIYGRDDRFLEKTSASRQVDRVAPQIPQERKSSSKKVSNDSLQYFAHLREEHLQMQKKSNQIDFSVFIKPKENTNEQHDS